MAVNNMMRRLCLKALGGVLAMSAMPLCAQAQDWPNRPVRFVAASAAGDPNDLMLRRFLQAAMPELNNMNLLVENKPGAGGMLAHQEVVKAPADGYTILLGNAALTLLPSVHKKLPYNPMTDFTPVSIVGMSAIGLAIPASRPEKNFKEWLAWAKTQKGKLNYGSGGNGSVAHMYGFQLSDQNDLDATHIAHRGAAPVLRDLVAGEIQYTILDIFALRGPLNNNQVKILAVSGTERSKFLPDVPTFKELGVQGFERSGWNAWFVRTGTPPVVLERLAQASNKVYQRPEWAAIREQFWIDWKPMTPAELGPQVRREAEAWAQVVKRSGYEGE